MTADSRTLLATATGADAAIDRALAEAWGAPPADYTASIDRCVDLLHHALPGWSWHLGWNAAGLLPYATVHLAHDHASAEAPTVPLALLRAMARARAGDLDLPKPPPELPAWRRR